MPSRQMLRVTAQSLTRCGAARRSEHFCDDIHGSELTANVVDQLKGQRLAVLGASSGIGFAVASLALEQGAEVFALDRLVDVRPTNSFDLVWTTQNYHDFHNLIDPQIATLNKTIFDALRPGGVYLVLDHAAASGSGARDANTLHRIDEASLKSEVEAAGFKLEGDSDLLHNPGDPRTANLRDPSIRGKTDQFILEFRKPKK